MASTACSKACLTLYSHQKPFSVSRAPAAHVTAPLPVFGSSCAVPPQKSVGLFSVRVGCSVAWNFRMDTNSLEWNERPRVVLVPFQPFQPGRNRLRHALRIPSIMYASLYKVQPRTAVCTAAAQGHFDVVVGAFTSIHSR